MALILARYDHRSTQTPRSNTEERAHAPVSAMPREVDDWVKIQKLQAVAVEEQKKARAIRQKQTQQTIRTHLDGQMGVQERRSMKAKEVKLLEAEKERLEFDQWVSEERSKKDVMHNKVREQKRVRDIQIQARRAKRSEESNQREREEAEEMLKIKAEIQRSKEESMARKYAEKQRLMQVFDEVDQQKKMKEIQKAKLAEEDRRAAQLYADMLDKQEAARASYFTRKVSDNESMVKKLDGEPSPPPPALRRRLQRPRPPAPITPTQSQHVALKLVICRYLWGCGPGADAEREGDAGAGGAN